MLRRGIGFLLAVTSTFFVTNLPVQAKESEDLQNQLAMAEDRLNTGRYCSTTQASAAVELDASIADLQKSLDANPGNGPIIAMISERVEWRKTVTQTIAQCQNLVATAGAEVTEIRNRLSIALATETAAAAEEAKKKVLSEVETKTAVDTATVEVAATQQRIQTDSYNVNDAKTKIDELTTSLNSVDKNSSTYIQIQASITALESIKKASESRIAQNLELQRQQKSLLEDLTSIQNNAVKINAAAAAELLFAAKSAKEALDNQTNLLEKQVDSIEDQVKKIDELLSRISKDSPDYGKLIETRNSLTTSIEQVKSEQQKVVEQVKENEELTQQAKEATLSKRIESIVLGKLAVDDEKPVMPTFKAKKVNAKYSEVKTKLIDTQSDDLNVITIDPAELEGVKVLLKSGKTVVKINKVSLNEDGTISFRIPRTAKSGTYTMTVDLPETENDVSLKVKVVNS